jgi:hypothetical protein
MSYRCRVLLFCLLSFVGSLAPTSITFAADFRVIIAKGVQEPPGLIRGAEVNGPLHVRLLPGGLLILHELAGCRQDWVFGGRTDITVSPSNGSICQPAKTMAEIRQRIDSGQPVSERVALRGEGRADGESELAGLDDACLRLPPVSEEQGIAQCGSGYLLSGIECSGSYCDNKRLRCCPYLGGQPDSTATRYGLPWISEETGGGRTNFVVTGDFLDGLACRGRYCDDIFPYAVRSQRIRNNGACSWSGQFSEEPPSGVSCPSGSYVSGIQCIGRYCDKLSLQCCRAQTP